VDDDADDKDNGDKSDDDGDVKGESDPTVGPGCSVGPCLLGPVRDKLNLSPVSIKTMLSQDQTRKGTETGS
jgi:hypothetical protein